MKRSSLIAPALAALALLPAAASAAPAGPLQRLEIERSAAKTHPCGYGGDSRQLSDFRIATFQRGHTKVQFASVRWGSPHLDACFLIFVSKPGETLKSVATSAHPFVIWAPLTWGSSPFDNPPELTRTWRLWFSFPPPHWLAVARAL